MSKTCIRFEYSRAMRRPRVGFFHVADSSIISHRIYDRDYFSQLSAELDTVRIDRREAADEYPAWFRGLQRQNIDYVFLFIFSIDYLDCLELLEARNSCDSPIGFILVPCILVPKLDELYREIPQYLLARDVVFIFSDYVRERLALISQRYDDFAVPCLVDVESFQDNTKPRSAVLDIVYCARLVPEKGLAELVEALGRIKQRRQFKLHIITDASPNQAVQSYASQVEYLIAEYELESRIVRHGSLLDRQQQRRDLMSRCDVLVHLTTDRGETFGRIVVEAFAAGLAVITTNWQGVNESVTTDNGYLVEVRRNGPLRIDINGVVAALEALYEPDVLERLKLWNRNKAARYDYRSHIRRLRELIEARLVTSR
jgi:glycosyltransferase involved in cell wall biosynthesis